MIYDIIVVGAGPAGLTAGANAANRGLKTLILEGMAQTGGQPQQMYPKKVIIDHPGFPKGVTGRTLSKRLHEQAEHSGADIRCHEPMVELDLKCNPKKITTRRNKFRGKRIILCTGLHNIPRQPKALKGYKGKRIHFYVKDPKKFKNKKILVIGDGDTAFDRANMLAPIAKETFIAIRGKCPKAKEVSIKRAKQNGARILYQTELVGIAGDRAILKKNRTSEKMLVDDVIV